STRRVRPPAATPFPYTTLFRSDRVHQRADDVHRQREHHGGVLVGTEFQERLQVAQLQGGRGLAERQGGVAQLLGGLQFAVGADRSEEHTSELQSRFELVCRLLL